MVDTRVGQEVLLLNPKGEQEVKQSSLAPRLKSLKGTTIAVVNAFRDPDRSNGDLVTRHMGEVLLREGVGRVIPIRKQESAKDMPQEMLESLAAQAEGVVILEGD
ncbi:MAG: hypothetical protein HYU29_00515 [Chloroflexi bacterium]|nr:hypothetical protein [Chloroflexota bacterium]